MNGSANGCSVSSGDSDDNDSEDRLNVVSRVCHSVTGKKSDRSKYGIVRQNRSPHSCCSLCHNNCEKCPSPSNPLSASLLQLGLTRKTSLSASSAVSSSKHCINSSHNCSSDNLNSNSKCPYCSHISVHIFYSNCCCCNCKIISKFSSSGKSQSKSHSSKSTSLFPPRCTCNPFGSSSKGGKNSYRSFSDSELYKMPSNFENSAMKNCFSLSSLPSNRARLEQSDHATTLPNRPYNSLTKNLRRCPSEQETWRNSWSNFKEKDEFWACLQTNYQYLMDNNLIESCKEAKEDLSLLSPSQDWTFEQLKRQFSELDSWLNNMQAAIYAKECNTTDRNLRMSHIEEMQRKHFQKKTYANQSARLVRKYPELKEEISWRLNHLVAKWDRIAQTVSPRRIKKDCLNVCFDVKRELSGLRKWVKMMEGKLQPVNLRALWSYEQLKEKAKEHQAIQKDVESRGKTVLSVVKLCESLSSSNHGTTAVGVTSPVDTPPDSAAESTDEQQTSSNSGEGSRILRIAHHWQRRWQLLYLRCIEWQCHIEEKLASFQQENASSNSDGSVDSEDDDDEQPALKHRRLDDTRLSCSSDIPFTELDPSAMDESATCVEEPSALVAQTSDMVDASGEERLGSPQHSTLNVTSYNMVSLNESFGTCYENSFCNAVTPDMLRKMTLDDSALFNRSDVSAPNYATYYYRHLDTDSEQEKCVPCDGGSSSCSSDEEWMYTPGRTITDESRETDLEIIGSGKELYESSPLAEPIQNRSLEEVECSDVGIENARQSALSSSKIEESGDENRGECVRKLVEKAEELVKEKHGLRKIAAGRKYQKCGASQSLLPPSGVSKGKHSSLVRKWLRSCQRNGEEDEDMVGDSCDASGEYTTEDEDPYERRSSCDQTLTLVGSSRDNGLDVSQYSENTDQSKVVLRVKSNPRKTTRPLSTSELHTPRSGLASKFSVSESALNKMSAFKDSAMKENLSSSTIEESTHALEGSACNSSSLRKRRLRHRRRATAVGRQCHVGSVESLSSIQRRRNSLKCLPPSGLQKLESLSVDSLSRRYSSTERAATSDPTSGVHASSGTETEEDKRTKGKNQVRKKLLALPAFKLGPVHGVVTSRDPNGMMDMMSAEEHHSSFSEQAWDSYQEKYMSEAYSEEPADPEQVKQLLEFGDDYRKYIDSQSDCTSSLNRRTYPSFRSSFFSTRESSPVDSDSELEIRSFIYRSHSQLLYCEHLLAKQLAKSATAMILTESDFANMKSTCRDNIRCLQVLLDNVDEELPLQQLRDIKTLIEKWESVETRTEELEKLCLLQHDIASLRDQLRNITYKMPNMTSNLQDKSQLENNICVLKSEISSLKEKKSQVTKCNVLAHRMISDSKSPLPSLKDDVTELYRIWEETYQKLTEQLTSLQQTLSTWQHFELHLAELQTALHGDQHTLHMLDYAIQHGKFSQDIASSVRDIAKILSDKRDIASGAKEATVSSVLPENSVVSFCSSLIRPSAFSIEGSLSDSGISDSGSEQDLSEREKRLATLKKLARHLESVLAPGSAALLSIMKRIEETEGELRDLQQTCRSLIAKTTSQIEDENSQKKNDVIVSSKKKRKGSKSEIEDPSAPNEPKKPKPFFWRILKAALPFHMAIVVLVCIACLLEPKCCDTLNTFNFSLLPQLKYISGPPPT